MNSTLFQILVNSIYFPVIVGCVRFKKLDTTYLPFIYLIWLGLINETVSDIVIRKGYYSNLNLNIYTFLESLLIIWQFEKWKFFRNPKKTIPSLVAFLFCVWLAENIYFRFYTAVNSLYIITESYIVVLLSISMINKIVIKIHGSLFKNATFLICLCWLVFFAFQIISESFIVYGLSVSLAYAGLFHDIFLWVNCFTNLALGFAILCIPTKPIFILPSSSPV